MPNTTTFSPEAIEKARRFLQRIQAADALELDNSPLLQGLGSDALTPADLDPSNPDETAFHVSWESEGLDFEVTFTVGALIDAMEKPIVGNSIELLDSDGQDCTLTLYTLTPLDLGDLNPD